MAPIKLSFLKSTNSLIVLLISILGFSSSCKKGEDRYAYGSPSASYLLQGSIQSKVDNQGIPDIKLEMFPVTGTIEQLAGSARSDIHGRYQLINYDFNSQADHTYRVKITDVDGELNGAYQSLDTTVVLQNTKFINGDGSWYAGVAETELNIKLKPKQ